MKKPNSNKRLHKFYKETARLRLLEIFYQYPEKEFSLSDLAKEAGVAKANIGKILEEFQKENIIEITKLSKIWRIKANRENMSFQKGKIVYNLNSIYQSGIIEFLDEYYHRPKSITLFGSFRYGKDISDSDIDIAIELEETKNYKIESLRELSKFESEIKRKVQIHLFNRKNIDINVFNNIANGILLAGFLEVKL